MPPTGQRRPQRQEVRGGAGLVRFSIRGAWACRPKWAVGPSRRAGRTRGGRGAASNQTRPRPEFLRRVLGSLGQSRLRPWPSLRPAGARGGRRSGHCPPSGCISVPARGGRRAGARDTRVPGLGGLGGVSRLRVPGRDREPPTGAREPPAGPGPVPGHRGKDDPAALGPSARGRCRSLDGPLHAQVQGQLGRREEHRAGPAGTLRPGSGAGAACCSLPLGRWKPVASLYRGRPGLGEPQKVQGCWPQRPLGAEATGRELEMQEGPHQPPGLSTPPGPPRPGVGGRDAMSPGHGAAAVSGTAGSRPRAVGWAGLCGAGCMQSEAAPARPPGAYGRAGPAVSPGQRVQHRLSGCSRGRRTHHASGPWVLRACEAAGIPGRHALQHSHQGHGR